MVSVVCDPFPFDGDPLAMEPQLPATQNGPVYPASLSVTVCCWLAPVNETDCGAALSGAGVGVDTGTGAEIEPPPPPPHPDITTLAAATIAAALTRWTRTRLRSFREPTRFGALRAQIGRELLYGGTQRDLAAVTIRSVARSTTTMSIGRRAGTFRTRCDRFALLCFCCGCVLAGAIV